MYRQLFILLYQLITNPVATWKILSEKQHKNSNNEDFYKNYLFPIIGIIALLSFIGIVIHGKGFDVQLALKTVLKNVMIYGGSFYFISFFLSEFIYPRFELEKDKISSELFVGYSSVLIYVVAMLKGLMPFLFFLDIFSIYSVYIIWTGASSFLALKEELWIKFTIFAGILILLTPYLLNLLINLLMPGMRI